LSTISKCDTWGQLFYNLLELNAPSVTPHNPFNPKPYGGVLIPITSHNLLFVRKNPDMTLFFTVAVFKFSLVGYTRRGDLKKRDEGT